MDTRLADLCNLWKAVDKTGVWKIPKFEWDDLSTFPQP